MRIYSTQKGISCFVCCTFCFFLHWPGCLCLFSLSLRSVRCFFVDFAWSFFVLYSSFAAEEREGKDVLKFCVAMYCMVHVIIIAT